MSFSKVLLPLALVATIVSVSAPVVAAPATLNSGNTAKGNQGWSGVGLTFDVISKITVLQMGIYDSDANGLTNSLSAYLFNTNTTAVVASQVFASGSGALSGVLDTSTVGQYRYLDNSFDLDPGRYTLMGYGFSSSDLEHNCNNGGFCETFSGSPLVSYVTSNWTSSSNASAGTFPSSSGTENYFAAANLKFEAFNANQNGVPEPGTLALLGLALAGLGWSRRKSA